MLRLIGPPWVTETSARAVFGLGRCEFRRWPAALRIRRRRAGRVIRYQLRDVERLANTAGARLAREHLR